MEYWQHVLICTNITGTGLDRPVTLRYHFKVPCQRKPKRCPNLPTQPMLILGLSKVLMNTFDKESMSIGYMVLLVSIYIRLLSTHSDTGEYHKAQTSHSEISQNDHHNPQKAEMFNYKSVHFHLSVPTARDCF